MTIGTVPFVFRKRLISHKIRLPAEIIVFLCFPASPFFTMTAQLNPDIARSVLAAKLSPTKTFSRSHPRSPPKDDAVAALLKVGADPDQLHHLLNNPDFVQQKVFVRDGLLQVITRPTPASTSDGSPIVIGSMSDTIETIVPVSGAKTYFTAHFTSLVSASDAADLDLPTAIEDPQILEGPPPADGSPADPPGFERLHFTVNNPDDAPVAIALPVALPVPVGIPIPLGHPVATPLTDEQCPYKPLRTWAKAVAYLIAHNDGVPVTHGGLLFTPESFDPQPFAALTIIPSITVPPISMLYPESPQYLNVMNILQQEQQSAYCDYAPGD